MTSADHKRDFGSSSVQDSLEDYAEGDREGEPTKKSRRSFLTQNACTRCRKKKAKCDGAKSSCGRCQRDGAVCVYDSVDGLTRMQNLQHQLKLSSEKHARLQTLLDTLQNGTDQQASNVLARLRFGESIDQLADSMTEKKQGSALDTESKTNTKKPLERPSTLDPELEYFPT